LPKKNGSELHLSSMYFVGKKKLLIHFPNLFCFFGKKVCKLLKDKVKIIDSLPQLILFFWQKSLQTVEKQSF